MKETGIDALRRAIKILGSQAAVASVVGVKQPSVHYFLKTANADVPAEWCPKLDIATTAKGNRVSCHDLRPDLWTEEFDPSDLIGDAA